MKTKQEIAYILINKLNYTYCHNCNADDYDDYHRKSMGWSFGKSTSNDIAEKTLSDN